MNKSKICINLFRVSSDSKYLDMIFSCPEGYYFTSLFLEVRIPSGSKFISKMFDVSTALFMSQGEPIEDKQDWTVRIPLDKLGINTPAIYKATFKIEKIEDQEQSQCEPQVDCNCQNDSCLEDHAICSDVNQVYKCMLKELMKLEDPCFEVSDDLIREYLLLYGHQSALTLGDLEIAERYFRLIVNCFDNCSNPCGCTCGQPKPVNINSCNCHQS